MILNMESIFYDDNRGSIYRNLNSGGFDIFFFVLMPDKKKKSGSALF